MRAGPWCELSKDIRMNTKRTEIVELHLIEWSEQETFPIRDAHEHRGELGCHHKGRGSRCVAVVPALERTALLSECLSHIPHFAMIRGSSATIFPLVFLSDALPSSRPAWMGRFPSTQSNEYMNCLRSGRLSLLYPCSMRTGSRAEGRYSPHTLTEVVS